MNEQAEKAQRGFDAAALDWSKGDGLLPAIVQDWRTGAVLMLGYVDRAALDQTMQSGKVTFWSRSKRRLWTKGETSGNFLLLKTLHADCDNDSLLVGAEPQGPTCHLGSSSCFGAAAPSLAFLAELDALIARRERDRPAGSYATKLFEGGVRRIAQKVGEEGVETALAGAGGDDAELLGEAADLLFHLIVLLRARGHSIDEVIATLANRHVARG
jgi:phosphoribosyl-ATP pyrophosphohydrolase/phosphoribosyl-AMP cyclohydrolase